MKLDLRHLQQIEALDNHRNFAREVSPTAFGKHALRLGSSILRDARRLEREMDMLADLETGIVRIGIGPWRLKSCLEELLDVWGRIILDLPYEQRWNGCPLSWKA